MPFRELCKTTGQHRTNPHTPVHRRWVKFKSLKLVVYVQVRSLNQKLFVFKNESFIRTVGIRMLLL